MSHWLSSMWCLSGSSSSSHPTWTTQINTIQSSYDSVFGMNAAAFIRPIVCASHIAQEQNWSLLSMPASIVQQCNTTRAKALDARSMHSQLAPTFRLVPISMGNSFRTMFQAKHWAQTMNMHTQTQTDRERERENWSSLDQNHSIRIALHWRRRTVFGLDKRRDTDQHTIAWNNDMTRTFVVE